MVNDKYNIKQRNFDIMRNSKSQGEALYEKIMSELEPIVKTVLGEAMGVKKPMNKQLNELSLPTVVHTLIKALRYGNNELADNIYGELSDGYYGPETIMVVDSGPVKAIRLSLHCWPELFDDNLGNDRIIYDIDIDFYASKESIENDENVLYDIKGSSNGYSFGKIDLEKDYIISKDGIMNIFNRTDSKRIADWINSQLGSHLSWRNFYGPVAELKDKIYESKKIPKSKKLNEMSDDMLNRAIVAAVDKGDFERAKKFSDYRKSDIRKENLNKIPFKKGELDTRSINFLKANGINSPYQLLNMTKDEFYALKPGKKTMMMILDYLDGYFNDTHLNKYYR